MKKIIFPVVVIVALIALLLPGAVQAGSGLVVSPTLAVVNFPTSVSVSIGAQSDVNITDIRLHYTVQRKAFAQVIAEADVAFTPAKTVNTQWVWDMRKTGALPTGALMTYWVTVTDASGKQVDTLPDTVRFNDSRYDWKKIQQGQVTLYWYKGENSFSQALMDAAQSALTRLSANTGAELSSPVTFYIYASADDLQGAMIYPQEWTGGVAYSEYGIITIGIDPADLDWGERTISHELTHLVVYQVTANPYNDLPTWLNEGLAMYSEGPLEPIFLQALSSASSQKALISVQSLCSPFPATYDQAVLSYAESYKIVAYLINVKGRDKMLELLNVFQQGSGYNEALEKVYGFDMHGLDSLWHNTTVPAVVG